jgi:hypothetical protein
MENWRLVLNAVCLPVLSYRSQLWYLMGGPKDYSIWYSRFRMIWSSR